MTLPPDPRFRITVIKERRQAGRAPKSDEEEEDEEDLEDEQAFATQKASGCAPTGLGCLVLLGAPVLVWLAS